MDFGGRTGSETYPFRRQSTKRSFGTMAESHRSCSPSSLFYDTHDDHHNNEHMAQRPRLALPSALPSAARPRFPGDGRDFRTPVNYATPPTTANHNNTVIDLTEDDDSQARMTLDSRGTPAVGSSRAQRLPRYDRDIIGIPSDDEEDDDDDGDGEDIDGEEDETMTQADTYSNPTHSTTHAHHPSRYPASTMDEVEFIEARPRSRPQTESRTHTPAAIHHRHGHAPSQRAGTPHPIDLTADMDDDVVHVDTRARTGVNMDPPTGVWDLMQGNTHYLRRLFYGVLPDLPDRPYVQQTRHNVHPQARNRIGAAGVRMLRQNMPHPLPATMDIFMEYELPAFDLGTGGNGPVSPKYNPPTPAQDGFTRSPGEDDIVVCPNCGDELAMGETDLKQQIWVIKNCGHAYCGECAHNRLKGNSKSSKKGKARAIDPLGPPLFKACVVNDCKAAANSKTMIHVFLGS